jgi:pyrimidine deaminase RibD-like protein
MRLALDEGRRALPGCLPNPPVGAVLVRAGEVIARGYTQPPGKPHAEAMTLAQVDGPLDDCVLYVTLEPCSFQGRTASCAEALVARGIGVVVVALTDPDERNAGRGLERLRAAGVPVFLGTLAREAKAELGPYLALPANRIKTETSDVSARGA